MHILPYTVVDGVPTLPDSAVMELFLRMEEEGSLDMAFSGGEVRTPEEFLLVMKQPGNSLFVLLLRDEPVGFFWLNGFEGRMARVHFCLFKRVWGPGSMILGRKILDYSLNLRGANGEYLLDVLLGVTPEKNRLACRFAKRSGMTPLGVLPAGAFNARQGCSGPALVSWATRDGLNVGS